MKNFFPTTPTRTTKLTLLATAAACGIGQYYYGDETNFYDYRFVVDTNT